MLSGCCSTARNVTVMPCSQNAQPITAKVEFCRGFVVTYKDQDAQLLLHATRAKAIVEAQAEEKQSQRVDELESGSEHCEPLALASASCAEAEQRREARERACLEQELVLSPTNS